MKFFSKSVLVFSLNLFLLNCVYEGAFHNVEAAGRGDKKKRKDMVAECHKALEGKKKPASAAEVFADNEIADPVLLDTAEKLVKLAVKNHRIPTQAELASRLDTSPAKLREYFKLLKVENTAELLKMAWGLFKGDFQKSTDYMIGKAAHFVRQRGRAPKRDELSNLTSTPVDHLEAMYGSLDDLLTQVRNRHPKDSDVARNRIIKAFVKLAKHFGRQPHENELADELDLQPDELKEFFGKNRPFKSYETLVNMVFANPTHQKALKDSINTEIFSEERAERMIHAIKNRKRLIVTTAVAGHTVNENFLKALLKYCDDNDAEIIVYPSNLQTTGLAKVLLDHPKVHILTNTVELGDDLALNNIKILAKMRNPLEGLDVLGQFRGQSQIVGNPKLHMKTVATADNEIRNHILTTTGALTNPDYNGPKYIQGRTDALTEKEHFLGALVLEKSNGSNVFPYVGNIHGGFHIRPLQFIEEKSGFTDLNKFYSASGVSKSKIKAISMGDIHVGSSDQKLIQALKEQILTLNPEYLVLHDLLDGYTISHHDNQKLITVAHKAEAGKLNLQEELENVIIFLNSLLAANPNLKIVVVHSNHNHWLTRWLNDSKHTQEPANIKIGNILAGMAFDGRDALETTIRFGASSFNQETGERRYVINPVNDPDRVVFVNTGEAFRIGPKQRRVDLGFHGHAGAAGGKGSLKAFEKGANGVIYGHTHTVQIRNNAINMGTSTHLILPYSVDGLSNWVQGLVSVDENGGKQLLMFKDGEWYTPEGEKVLPPEEFFEEGYPNLIPNKETTSEGDFDQYGGKGSTAGQHHGNPLL